MYCFRHVIMADLKNFLHIDLQRGKHYVPAGGRLRLLLRSLKV